LLVAAHIRPHPYPSLASDKNETLCNFIDRFSKAALRTPNLTQEMILQCITLTLKPCPFANNVYLQPPCTNSNYALRITSVWRRCRLYTPSSATTIKDGNGAGRDGDGFHYPILIPIPIPKPNGYQTFIPSLSPPG